MFEYASLRGTLDGMDTTVIRDIATTTRRISATTIWERMPFVGRDFNVTRAGIHADGILKDEEIYNIFDPGKLLKSPPTVAVSNTSGLAGIAVWLSTHLFHGQSIAKDDPRVAQLKDWWTGSTPAAAPPPSARKSWWPPAQLAHSAGG